MRILCCLRYRITQAQLSVNILVCEQLLKRYCYGVTSLGEAPPTRSPDIHKPEKLTFCGNILPKSTDKSVKQGSAITWLGKIIRLFK